MDWTKFAFQASPEQRFEAAKQRWQSGQRHRPFPSEFGIHAQGHSGGQPAGPEARQHPAAPGQVPAQPKSIPPLLPQQTGGVNFIAEHHGQGILAHVTGAGKTRTSVAAVEELRRRGLAHKTLVITPSALRTNYAQEGVHRFTDSHAAIIRSHGESGPGYVSYKQPDPNAHYHVVSYDMFRLHPDEILKNTGADTLVLDELHRVKNEGGETFKTIERIRPQVKNVIGMTGSLISTHPTNILQPINIVTGGQHNLGTQSQFEERFLRREQPSMGQQVHQTVKNWIHPTSWINWFAGKKPHQHKGEILGWKNTDELREELKKHVHYVGPEHISGQQPKKNVEVVRVEMSPAQEQLYRVAMKEIPPPIASKLETGEGLNEEEETKVFNRLVKARQVSNSMHTFGTMPLEQAAQETPKLQKMLDDLEDHQTQVPDAQTMIYTNLIHGGTDIIAEGLKQRGIPFGVFIGKGNDVDGHHVSEQTRNRDVEDYKAGKLKVMIVSAAGNEGLSLPNTTQELMFDGFYNPEKVLQAEARGIRVGGLSHRAPENRVVDVKRYVTVYPENKSLFGAFKSYFKEQKDSDAVDSWIYSRADKRHQLNQSMYDVIENRPIGEHHLMPQEPEKPKPSGWWPFGKVSFDLSYNNAHIRAFAVKSAAAVLYDNGHCEEQIYEDRTAACRYYGGDLRPVEGSWPGRIDKSGQLSMALSLLLRKDDPGHEVLSSNGGHRVLRVSAEGAGDSCLHDTWQKRYNYLPNLDRNKTEDGEPQMQGIPSVWGPRNRSVREVEELQGILCGRRRPAYGHEFGTNKQRWGLRTREYPMGDAAGTSSQQELKPISDLSRKKNDSDRVGAPDGDQPKCASRASFEGMVNRGGTDNTSSEKTIQRKDYLAYYGTPGHHIQQLAKTLNNAQGTMVRLDSGNIRRNSSEGVPIQVRNMQDIKELARRHAQEFHKTIGPFANEVWVDIDPHHVPLHTTIRTTSLVAQALQQMPEVQFVSTRYSGGRGFYVEGKLHEPAATRELRSKLEAALQPTLAQEPQTTLKPPKPGQIRLDLSTFHDKGSIRAPYSLHAGTGRVSVPVQDLGRFKPSSATLEKILAEMGGSRTKTGAFQLPLPYKAKRHKDDPKTQTPACQMPNSIEWNQTYHVDFGPERADVP